MSAKQAKPRLSKGILEMKFMQRTKAKVDKEIEAAEGRAMYSNEITDKMLRSGSNFVIEPSFAHCEGLIEGRLSFRGMNPEIERLLELEQAERDASKRVDQKVEVSDKDMAAFYHAQQAPAATKIMHKKFQKNNQSNNKNNSNKKRHSYDNEFPRSKKLKFEKPCDDDVAV